MYNIKTTPNRFEARAAAAAAATGHDRLSCRRSERTRSGVLCMFGKYIADHVKLFLVHAFFQDMSESETHNITGNIQAHDRCKHFNNHMQT